MCKSFRLYIYAPFCKARNVAYGFYGIALKGMGDDAKFGAAGLIMAILGGSVLPPLQASIIDCKTLFGMPAVNISFILPLICFVVIVVYGYKMRREG